MLSKHGFIVKYFSISCNGQATYSYACDIRVIRNYLGLNLKDKSIDV